MSRLFAYCRVSKDSQTTANQLGEIEAAGFKVEPSRVTAEHISGGTYAQERKGFSALLKKLEAGDVLIVTKIDRLGRSLLDVVSTIDTLTALQVRVHCLALGGTDLTSPAGKLVLGIMAACAQFERELLIERTNAGIARAKKEGKRFGRPNALTEAQQNDVLKYLSLGASISELARKHATSRQVIMRIRDKKVLA